jgi:hypothetical protein
MIMYRIFGHPRLLMRGLSGAKVEIGIATKAYNPMRMARNAGPENTVRSCTPIRKISLRKG